MTEHTPPEPYTLSLHDALPICATFDKSPSAKLPPMSECEPRKPRSIRVPFAGAGCPRIDSSGNSDRYSFNATADRKSTRLNSSHANISYAVFCLKKKKRVIFVS